MSHPPSRPADDAAVAGDAAGAGEEGGFRVALANFEGPFDALLQLIGQRKMDVTEVALAEVTDEFIAYTRGLEAGRDLAEITGFLVVAATLLDLKAARLLPRGEVEDEADLELLSRRDLLFARLLQYRAYREAAALFRRLMDGARRSHPRAVGPEPGHADLLPPVDLGLDAAGFAELAAGVFRRRPPDRVDDSHLHRSAVSVPEQAGRLLALLRAAGPGTWLPFEHLSADCRSSLETVGRFLALLELFKAHALEVEQADSLGPLRAAWSGAVVDPAVVAAANWD